MTRFLLDHGVKVVEVDRSDRRTRRQRGKSDPIDAEAAARAVLAGDATATPKNRSGPAGHLRALLVARRVIPFFAMRCIPTPAYHSQTASRWEAECASLKLA